MPARKEKAAKMPRIGAARERWEREVLSPVIAKSPERRKRFESTSGEAIERLYTPQGQEPFDYLEDAGFPGEYPFTRGVQPTMYRGRFWTMRQYAGFGDARESNRRYRYLLAQGQTGLSVALALPTNTGVASALPFVFNAHNNFLEEVAKFRAANRLWARIMRDRFRANDPRSWMLRFHTQTAGSSLTAQQPDNNVVRVTVQALAALPGGAAAPPP